jgi:phosphoglucosamine mutase
MSNLGLHVWAREQGITLRTTAVGDRYVLEDMLAGGYTLGGENSGHVIFTEHATTGDGQLTALKLLSLLGAAKTPLSELAKTMEIYPQVLLNVPVSFENRLRVSERPEVKAEIARVEQRLGDEGRVLVRPSGTENLVRVMLEGKDKAEITELASGIASVMAGL